MGEDPPLPFITKEYYSLFDRDSETAFAAAGWAPSPAELQALADMKLTDLKDWFDLAQIRGLMPEIGVGYKSYQLLDDVILDPAQFIIDETLDLEIRALAQVVKDFGAPVYVRPGFEPRKFQVAPYKNGHTPGSESYTGAYRRIVDLFREEGVENAAFIWCSGPFQENLSLAGDPPELDAPWFPGDRYVDWIGIDVFRRAHFTPGDPAYAPTLRMLELADKWKKPIIIAETSARYEGPPGPTQIESTEPGDGDCGSSTPSEYWDNWFGPFFDFMEDNPRIKAFSYINWNWPDHNFPSPPWGAMALSFQNLKLCRADGID